MRCGIPDAEEGFLGDVFGGVPIGESAVGEGEDLFVMAQKEFAEGGFAALGEFGHELDVRE